MPRKTNKKTKIEAKRKKAITYSPPENPIEFYISEEAASYGNNGKKKPYSLYYKGLRVRV
ncbi:MAG: hypothetical protein HY756_09960 [Nitrospirae bacterium]|nr:hypothetical protein [Nitrospirota bacterium]